MVLITGLGFALGYFAGLPLAAPIGFAIGVLVAPLVPARTACGIRQPDQDASRDAA